MFFIPYLTYSSLPLNSIRKLNAIVMTDNAFKARDIGLRAQKKILSRMATKTIAKTFIDGTTASLLDNVYALAKLHVSYSFIIYVISLAVAIKSMTLYTLI